MEPLLYLALLTAGGATVFTGLTGRFAVLLAAIFSPERLVTPASLGITPLPAYVPKANLPADEQTALWPGESDLSQVGPGGGGTSLPPGTTPPELTPTAPPELPPFTPPLELGPGGGGILGEIPVAI